MTTGSPDSFDEALTRRLGRLSTMPVDTSALERRVRAEIGTAVPTAQGRHPYRLMRTLLGIAASLLIVALVGTVFLQGRPAQAAPDAQLMMQLHRDIVSGKVPTMAVKSVDEVNRAFAAFGQSGVRMSAPPEMSVMGCCMKDVGNKKVACILLNQERVPVTLTVAELDAVKPLDTPVVMHDGESFHVQSGGDLTMVTVDRAAHRICLIGALPADTLMTLTEKLKF